MNETIFVVDAFADVPFAGNPAAVCLLTGEKDADWMQRVAAEMNLSETAFLIEHATGEWGLRWFTPKVEVDLCGHATLASAHVLWRECGVSADTLRFTTRSGLLTARREGESVCLDFPADPPAAAVPADTLIAALGVEPLWVGRGRDDLLVVLDSAERVRSLAPDMTRLASLDARGVIVTAAGDRPEYDFVSRFFGPGVGIPEDPVTGSAHCCLAPYWAARLGKSALWGNQASARGGVVGVELHGERVHLLGRAVTVLKGALYA